MNGDGKPDIVITLTESDVIEAFRNPSSPGGAIILTSESTKVVGRAPKAIAAGDLNGDGKSRHARALVLGRLPREGGACSGHSVTASGR